MTVQPISPTAFLLYLSRVDLQERGLHPDFLIREDTWKLAKEGLSSLGRTADDLVEVESYPDRHGLLLFVHTLPGDPAVWRFPDSDCLLDAVAAVEGLAEQPLYWWQDAFWLVAPSGPDAALSEFADRVEDDPLLSARLAEYALPIF